MTRRTAPDADPALEAASEAAPATRRVDLSGLGIAGLHGIASVGIGRRRAAFLAGTFATIWIVAIFARQVGDAAAATLTADELRADKSALASEISALEGELQQIQGIAYIAQQARAYDLGSAKERAFALAPDAPPLAADAPGSAVTRLGSDVNRHSPLEAWLTAIFGPRG